MIYEEPASKRKDRTLALSLPLVAGLHRHGAAPLRKRMLAGSEGTARNRSSPGPTAGPSTGTPEARQGDARPQPDAHDDGHSTPRHAGPGPRSRRPHESRLLTGKARPTATRDDSGRSPEGERAWSSRWS